MDYGTTFLLDSSGDIQFDEIKRLRMTSSDDEKVKQDVKIALKTFLSEDIFSPEFGLDMLKIKQHGYNKKLIEAEIRKALKKYKYLKSIDKIEVGGLDNNRNVNVVVYITTTSDLSLAIGVAL